MWSFTFSHVAFCKTIWATPSRGTDVRQRLSRISRYLYFLTQQKSALKFNVSVRLTSHVKVSQITIKMSDSLGPPKFTGLLRPNPGPVHGPFYEPFQPSQCIKPQMGPRSTSMLCYAWITRLFYFWHLTEQHTSIYTEAQKKQRETGGFSK